MRLMTAPMRSGYSAIHSMAFPWPMRRVRHSLASIMLPYTGKSGRSDLTVSIHGGELRWNPSPTPAIWLSPAAKKRRRSRGSSNSARSSFSNVSVSQARISGMGYSKCLCMIAPKPVFTTTSSGVSLSVSNGRIHGSMFGTVTIQSRS